MPYDRGVPLFERAFESVKAFAEKQTVNIKLVDNDIRIYADGDRIIQVLINLLSNAIKFSPADSTITSEAEPVENSFVELRVIDQGRGIPESFLKHMFQRFQQVDQIGDAKKRKAQGLGLPSANHSSSCTAAKSACAQLKVREALSGSHSGR